MERLDTSVNVHMAILATIAEVILRHSFNTTYYRDLYVMLFYF